MKKLAICTAYKISIHPILSAQTVGTCSATHFDESDQYPSVPVRTDAGHCKLAARHFVKPSLNMPVGQSPHLLLPGMLMHFRLGSHPPLFVAHSLTSASEKQYQRISKSNSHVCCRDDTMPVYGGQHNGSIPCEECLIHIFIQFHNSNSTTCHENIRGRGKSSTHICRHMSPQIAKQGVVFLITADQIHNTTGT